MVETNRTRYLVKNLLLFGAASFAPKFFGFLLVPLYTNYLTTSDYGFVDLLSATANLIYPVVTVGIGNAVLAYIINTKVVQQRFFPATFGFLITVTGDAIAVVIIFSLGLNTDIAFDFDSAIWLSVFVVLDSLYSYMLGYMRGANHVGLLAITSIVNSMVSLVSAIVLIAYFNWGVYGYLTSMCLGSASSIFVSIIGSKLWRSLALASLKKKRNKPLAKKMLAYSFPLVFSGIAWWLNSSVDRYVVTFFCGVAANGIYSIAYRIPAIVSAFQGVFAQAWLLSAFEETTVADSYSYFRCVYNIYSLTLTVICAGIMFLNIPLAGFLYANEFFQAWKIAPVLVMSAFFIALGSFGESIFQSKYDTAVIAWTMIAGAIVNIVASCILAMIVGPIGVAFSTLLGYLVTWISRLVILRLRYSCCLSIGKPLFSLFLLLAQYYLMTTLGFDVCILLPCVFVPIIYSQEVRSLFSRIMQLLEGGG